MSASVNSKRSKTRRPEKGTEEREKEYLVQYLGRNDHVKRGVITHKNYHFQGSDRTALVLESDLEEILGGNFRLSKSENKKPKPKEEPKAPAEDNAPDPKPEGAILKKAEGPEDPKGKPTTGKPKGPTPPEVV